MSYRNLDAGIAWWNRIFGAERVPLPEWDDPLPSDVALKLPDEEEPHILLQAFHEAGEITGQTHPLVFTGNIEAALGNIGSDAGGAKFFDVRDLKGQSIEVCENE